jgi:hypothetical protein
MSTEQNKAVVRRFITEVLVGGQVDLVDDLLATNYVNRAMGGLDRAGFKAFLTAASAAPGVGWKSKTWWPKGTQWWLAARMRSPSPPGRRSPLGA